MIGLELLSGTLVDKLRLASAPKQGAASLAACEFAIAHAHVEHPLVEMPLHKVRATGLLPPKEKAWIDALTTRLDVEYLDLQEAAEEGKASTEEYLQVFAKARAIVALSFAGNEDPFMGATESIYEAGATIRCDDKGDLFAAVESALE
jgi:hypothetical protein